MKNICLECFTLEELIAALATLINATIISENSKTASKDPLLSRKEAAGILKITLTTLNTWTKQQKIISYRQGSRVYYKEEELLESLKRIDYQKYKKNNSL